MSEAACAMSEFGTALRRAREERRLSIEDAAKACLLSDTQVLGLEGADIGPFYSLAYARRAARRYAQYLDIQAIPEIGAAHPKGAVARPLDGAALRARLLMKVEDLRRHRLWPLWVLLLAALPACAVVLKPHGLSWRGVIDMLVAAPLESAAAAAPAACRHFSSAGPAAACASAADDGGRPNEERARRANLQATGFSSDAS